MSQHVTGKKVPSINTVKVQSPRLQLCNRPGFPGGASGKESVCQCKRHKRAAFDLWVGKSPWSGKCNPLQYSCLEKSMDTGAWQAIVQFSSVAQSCLTLCDPMDCSTPGLPVHQQLPEFTQTHVHPTIPSSVIPFSSHLQSFPAAGSFLMSQFFTSGGQSIGVSASTSVLPMNIQD